ncbi:MAG TPA: hypothetical protein VN253_11835 [Kofleriaceae bacterium]|nr:hypothetical protein [Kofleriaceae bacterium]
MTRTLQIRGVGAESGDHLEALRLKGPPIETIKVEAEIDATDDLESNDAQTRQVGLHPQLAVLEMIVHPTSGHLVSNHLEAQSGSIEIAPQEAPLPLFVFGPKRIVPVRITELSITEEAFDITLNPIRAKVSLGMRVLTTDDLGFDARGGSLFLAYLQTKEQLAQRLGAGSFSTLGIRGIP